MTQEEIVQILAALGVEEISFRLEGYGDNGDIELEDAIKWATLNLDGNPVIAVDLEQLPFENGSLLNAIECSIEDWPDGDWINNEGGSGVIIIRPFDKECPIIIDMAYGFEEDCDEELGEVEVPESDDPTDPMASDSEIENISVEDETNNRRF
jgi:hypothetical protein